MCWKLMSCGHMCGNAHITMKVVNEDKKGEAKTPYGVLYGHQSHVGASHLLADTWQDPAQETSPPLRYRP